MTSGGMPRKERIMRTATAITGLVVLLLSCAVPVVGAQRAVLAEMYGATWCSNCPRSYDALQMHQAERGTDEFVVLYFHLSDALTTVECQQRAASYGVSGVPHLEFDATHTLIGSYGNADTMYIYYNPYIEDRAATPTPVTIDAVGVIGETEGWVTATFRADDAVPYGTIRAQFVLYEDNVESGGKYYDWTVRDLLPSEDILLVSAGDSVEVTRNYTIADTSWVCDKMHMAVFVERIGTPKEIINAVLLPDPYAAEFATSDYANEMDYLEESVYTVSLTNTGTVPDTFDVTVSNDFPSNPYEWIGIFCDDSGACYFEGAVGTYDLAPGESEILTVHVTDYAGTTAGMGLSYLTAVSRGDPGVSATHAFATFVDATPVTIIDDDDGGSYETHLETALAGAGYDAYVYDAAVEGRPDLVDLSSFGTAFWTTANGSANYVTSDDEQVMIDYLDGEGNLFLSSMNFLSSRGAATTFITDYMHVGSWVDDQSGFVLDGVAGDAISDGQQLLVLGGPFPVDASDSFTLAAGDTIFTSGAGTKGLKIEESGHRLVFMSSAFENVSTTEADPNNQKTLAERIMDWFVPPFTGVGDDPLNERHVLALGQNHPNPFNPVTTVSFTVPTGADRVSLRVYNAAGRLVRTLVDGEMSPGPKSIVWDGRDNYGEGVSSGVYFCRLDSAGASATKKMTLLK